MRTFLALLLAMLAAGACPAAEAVFRLPPHQRVTLGNGLTVLLLEKRGVPMASVHVVVRAGGTADPAGREGLAALTAELLRRGTTARSAREIAEQIDLMGGRFHVAADVDRASFSLDVLTRDLDAGLDLLAELLRRPSFPADEVGKITAQEIDGVKQAKEEALAVLPRYFYQALFRDHPYARPPGGDEASLGRIGREDVAAFHQRHYRPETVIIAVAGEFVPPDLVRRLEARFGDWRGAGPAPAPVAGTGADAASARVSGRRLVLVNKPDATQTFFAIGNLGIARNNADRVGILLVNTLFGGRFTSMLNEALRINSGLTYGATAQFQQHRGPGPFLVVTYTGNATTTNAIDLALETLGRLHRDGVNETQLKSAQAYLKGQFPPRLETTGQLAALLGDLEFHGLDEGEVNQLFARIDAFTVRDARRIIDRYYPKDDLVFVLIGKADEIRAAVGRYAPDRTEVELSAPGFGGRHP